MIISVRGQIYFQVTEFVVP